MALDIILASKGGTCALVGNECCTYIPDKSQEINEHIQSMEKALAVFEGKDPPASLSFWGWLPNVNGWIREMLKYLTIEAFILIVGFVCVQMIICCCKTAIRQARTTGIQLMIMKEIEKKQEKR